MKGFNVFAILLVVALASIDSVLCGGDSFPLPPVTSNIIIDEFTMPIDLENTEKVPSSASGRPCPPCLAGRNALSFDVWAAKHLERPGPANGSCAPNREKFIFIGEPDKCCCELIANP